MRASEWSSQQAHEKRRAQALAERIGMSRALCFYRRATTRSRAVYVNTMNDRYATALRRNALATHTLTLKV